MQPQIKISGHSYGIRQMIASIYRHRDAGSGAPQIRLKTLQTAIHT